MSVSNADEFHKACINKKEKIELENDIDLSQKNRSYIIWSNMELYGHGYTITTDKPVFSKNKNLIQNVTIEATIEAKGDFKIGGLVKDNSGEIKNCTVTGRVEADTKVGGLVGVNSSFGKDNFGEIKNCTSEATVKGDENGGIVGVNEAIPDAIVNCESIQELIGKQE